MEEEEVLRVREGEKGTRMGLEVESYASDRYAKRSRIVLHRLNNNIANLLL